MNRAAYDMFHHQDCQLQKFLTKFSEHPCSGIWFQNTPPPPPPTKFKTLIFFPESKSDLTQNPPPPLKFRQILALWVFTFQNNPPPPPPPVCGSWSMWRLIAVSPKDTISFNLARLGQTAEFL